jgi:O-antigen/teichoic acid export membrane protein
MSTATTVASNTAYQIVGKVITSATTFGISMILTHYLGVAGYGDFTKITVFVGLFTVATDFGLNAAYIQLDEKKIHPYFPSLLTARSILAIVTTTLCIGIAYLLPETATSGFTSNVKFGVLLFASSIFFQSMITTANAVFQKTHAYKDATVALFVGSLLSVAAIALAMPHASQTERLFTGLISLALGSCATAGVSMLLASKKEHTTIESNIQRIGELSVVALPLGMTLLINVVYFRIDSLLMSFMLPKESLGIYGLAYKLFEVPLVIPTFIMNAMYPFLVTAYTHHVHETFVRYIRTSAKLLGLFGVVVSAACFIGAPFITVFGVGFRSSIVPFQILSLGLPLFFLSSLTMWLLVTMELRRPLVAIYALSFLVNAVTNILFIPRFGYIAAAWTTVGSEALTLFCSYIILRRHRKNF